MQFSMMTFAPTYLVSLVYLILCCGPVQPEVSIRVSPERSQFFEEESIFLTCEEEGHSMVGWSVRRQSSDGETGTCGGKLGIGFGNVKGESCKVTPFPHDSGVYWCQSGSEVSTSINITISDGDVILESPVLPVPEGSDVTLRCLYKDQTSDRPADFYKDGSFFRSEPTGQMTILHVNKFDEGFYECNIPGLGDSPEIWMETRRSTYTDNINQPGPPSSSEPPHVSALVVSGVCVLILLLILALFLFLWRKYRGLCCVRAGGTNPNPGDDVYLPLQHGNTSTYGVINNSAVNDPIYVIPIESEGTNQGPPAAQATNQSDGSDDAYDPQQHAPGSSRRQHAADPVYSNISLLQIKPSTPW